jgi:hypothetical protein
MIEGGILVLPVSDLEKRRSLPTPANNVTLWPIEVDGGFVGETDL